MRTLVFHTFRQAHQANIIEGAASISFFTLFSLFPLCIVVMTAYSFFHHSLTEAKVLNMILELLPIEPSSMITNNLKNLLRVKKSFSYVSIVALLWSASTVFNVLIHNLQIAWPEARLRGFWKKRFMSFLAVMLLTFTVPFFFLAKTVLAYVMGREWLVLTRMRGPFMSLLPGILIYILIMLVYTTLYKVVPRHEVKWRHALAGAFIATLLSSFTTYIFSWYFGSRFSRYALIYGSLGTLMAFLSWVFILSLLVLFGAHLTAALRYGEKIHS